MNKRKKMYQNSEFIELMSLLTPKVTIILRKHKVHSLKARKELKRGTRSKSAIASHININS